MKQICILCFTILFIFFGCNRSNIAIPNTIREGLLGPVKKIRVNRENRFVSDSVESNVRIETLYEVFYDRKGYKTKRKNYVWVDDPNGGILSGSYLGFYEKYFYNSQRYKIKTEKYSSKHQLISYFHQNRDSGGNIYHEVYEDGDGNMIREWIVNWDTEKQVDVVSVKNATGTIEAIGYWYYDGVGNYIQKGNTEFDENVWLYMYDKFGTRRLYQRIDSDVKRKVKGYFAEQFTKNGQSEYRMSYNKPDGWVQFNEFEYVVDSHENWITEYMYLITRKNGQDHKDLVRTSFRDIEYYQD